MRIDMHVHYTPPEMAKDVHLLAREPFWRYLVNPGAKSVQGWASEERMLEDMDSAGIDRVVLQGEYFRTHSSCVERNNRVLNLVQRWPDRISAFAIVQPKEGQKALDELERCLDNGFGGVGEMSPFAQGYRLDDPDFLRIAELCIERGVPLLLHCNEEVGRHYRGKVPIPLSHYYQLAVRYPELRLVLAHWGGGLFFYEIIPNVKKALENVWYDTAASPLVFPTASIFKLAMDCVSSSKILYASDYPLLLYPKTQSEPDFRLFIGEISRIGLEAGDNTCIFRDNALSLLNRGSGHTAEKERPGLGILGEITARQSVSWVTEAYPATRQVFDKYGIAWVDSPLAFWEPIEQSACAVGLDSSQQDTLLSELNEAIKTS